MPSSTKLEHLEGRLLNLLAKIAPQKINHNEARKLLKTLVTAFEKRTEVSGQNIDANLGKKKAKI